MFHVVKYYFIAENIFRLYESTLGTMEQYLSKKCIVIWNYTV